MKNLNLFTIGVLASIGITAYSQDADSIVDAASPMISALVSRPVERTAKQDEIARILKDKYDMTPSQIKAYEALVIERDMAMDRAKFGNQSARSAAPKSKAILETFQKRVKEIMKPKQFAKWEDKKPRDYTIDAGLRAIFTEYWQKHQALNANIVPGDSVHASKLELNREYTDKMAKVVSREEAESRMRLFSAEKLAESPQVAAMELNRARSIEIAQMLYDKNMTERQIRGQKGVSRKELSMKLNANQRQFRTAVAGKLNRSELQKWQRYNAGDMDRKLKTVYNLSPEQIAELKNIDNYDKIQKTEIRNNTNLTPAEKVQQTRMVTEQSWTKITSVIPQDKQEQYRKTYFSHKPAKKRVAIPVQPIQAKPVQAQLVQAAVTPQSDQTAQAQ